MFFLKFYSSFHAIRHRPMHGMRVGLDTHRQGYRTYMHSAWQFIMGLWVPGPLNIVSLLFLVQLGNFTRTLLGSRHDSSNSRVYIGPFAASSQIIIGPGDQLFCHGQSGGTAFEIGSVHGVTCQYVKRWHSILCAWNWE